MKTIWKFPLEEVDSQTVFLPKGARIITVQVQGGQPCLWAVVDSEAQKEAVEIRTHGTGHSLPEDSHQYVHVGTYQLAKGLLVFHVFRLMSVGEAIMRGGIL